MFYMLIVRPRNSQCELCMNARWWVIDDHRWMMFAIYLLFIHLSSRLVSRSNFKTWSPGPGLWSDQKAMCAEGWRILLNIGGLFGSGWVGSSSVRGTINRSRRFRWRKTDRLVLRTGSNGWAMDELCVHRLPQKVTFHSRISNMKRNNVNRWVQGGRGL